MCGCNLGKAMNSCLGTVNSGSCELLRRTCQKKDWSSHKSACEKCGDPVGCPFMVSVPQSKANYSYLYQLLYDYTRYERSASFSFFYCSARPLNIDKFVTGMTNSRVTCFVAVGIR